MTHLGSSPAPLTLQNTTDPLRLLTKQQLAAALGVSARTVENLVRTGELPPGVRVGRMVYWTESVVDKWRKVRFLTQEGWLPQAFELL